MALLSQIEIDDTVEDKDSLGGGSNFQPVESGIYLATVTMAHELKSAKGSLGIRLTLLTDDKHEISENIYITSAKDNRKPTFKYPIVNSLSLLTSGKNIGEVVPETKVVDQWNYDLKKNIPTEVEMLTDLMNKEVYVGVLKVRENKKDYANNYAKLPGERVFNQLDKFFHGTSKLTTAQIATGQSEPTFFNDWKEKHTGTLVDKYEAVAPVIAPNIPVDVTASHNIFADEPS
jgi:hypothetical protein